MFKKKKTNDSSTVQNDLVDEMALKVKQNEKNDDTNIFKVTGKVVTRRITVLGEYKVLKLTNFKLRKKKYDPKILTRRMKETLKMKRLATNLTEDTSVTNSNEGNY
jgi:hypothetical protein